MEKTDIIKSDIKRKQKFLAFTGFVLIIIIGNVFSIEYVEGHSMENGLYNGDIELCIKKEFCQIRHNDIVNINLSVLNKNIVKRVIGTGEDHIRMENGKLFRNDIYIEEYYVKNNSKDTFEIVVPNGYIYVMGDNRKHSIDSRNENIGFISEHDVESKMLLRISILEIFK